jgi:periplasmic protein TonB
MKEKIVLSAAIVVIVSSMAVAQYKIADTELAYARNELKVEAFSLVEKPAEYPGGIEKFYQYVYKNLRAPKNGWRKATTGKVFVEFTINADGSIDDESVRVLSASELGASADEIISDEAYEREAIRIVKECPDWLPARQDQHPVKQRLILPVAYR